MALTKQEAEQQAQAAWQAAEAASHAIALNPEDLEVKVQWRKAVMAAARAQWNVNQLATKAAPASRPARPKSSPNGAVVRFGRTKGQPLEEISDKELQWYADALAASIEHPDKQRWRRENESELETVHAEMERRR